MNYEDAWRWPTKAAGMQWGGRAQHGSLLGLAVGAAWLAGSLS